MTRILVIDDEPMMADSLKQNLSDRRMIGARGPHQSGLFRGLVPGVHCRIASEQLCLGADLLRGVAKAI